jgi:hypothetical protein
MDFIPIFGALFLIMIDILFFIIFVCSIFYFCNNIGRNFIQSIVPFGMNILTIGIIFGVVHFDTERKINFAVHKKARQEVIRLIQCRKLPGEGMINLPKKYCDISKENQIEVHRAENGLWVKFTTYHGFPGDFEGYIYSSKNQPPKQSWFFCMDAHVKYEKKDPHWFWFTHL